jgi:hypothetical protein
MANRFFNAWLRSACALFGIAGILLLSACGGGSGAPNNPYDPPPPVPGPLLLLPAAITVYPGTPETLTISGGVPPYRAFSSNSVALPVSANVSGSALVLAANTVSETTTVSITVQDAAGTTSPPAIVTVNPAPLLPSGVTVTGNFTPNCDTTVNAVCSGSTGNASVRITGLGGVGIQGRPIRFDVVQGTFQIVSTSPAQPLVTTLTVATDVNGTASVVLSVPPATPTQTGIIRVTDLTTGQQITGNFQILQITVQGEVLAMLPSGTTTITGPDTTHCSSGVSVTYVIVGGTPPYTVSTQFPQAIVLTGVPVNTNGGSFTATTNGACFTGLTFTVRDATGRTIPTGNAPTITNELGTTPPVPPSTPLVATPGVIARANCVPTNTFQFIGTGGTAPYSAVVTSSTSVSSPTLSPQTGLTSGQAVTVSGITSPSTTVISLLDNSTPRQTVSVTIDCSGAPPPPPPPPTPPLVVTPQTQGNTTQSCVGQTYAFVITGGTPPYNVFFQNPKAGAVITPASVPASGQTFTVSNLPNGQPTTNNITITDSSASTQVTVASVVCTP